MNSLESTKKLPMYWHKRQTLADIKRQAPMFRQLMEQSKQCMKEHPEFHGNDSASIKKQIACEVIHPQTLTPFSNFTFHTHPARIDYPSEADKKTTRKLNKEYLVIGVVPYMQNVVYEQSDGFQNMIMRFS